MSKNLEKKLKKLSKKPRMNYFKEEIGLHFNLLSQKNEVSSERTIMSMEFSTSQGLLWLG